MRIVGLLQLRVRTRLLALGVRAFLFPVLIVVLVCLFAAPSRRDVTAGSPSGIRGQGAENYADRCRAALMLECRAWCPATSEPGRRACEDECSDRMSACEQDGYDWLDGRDHAARTGDHRRTITGRPATTRPTGAGTPALL